MQWRAETSARFGLDTDTVTDLEARRWHYRLFRGRYVSLHPTRADHEIREAYGARRYTPLGRATVEARVTDASEAMFLPAVYRVAEAVWREGGPGRSTRSWRSKACTASAAEAGERVLVTGHLEAERAGYAPARRRVRLPARRRIAPGPQRPNSSPVTEASHSRRRRRLPGVGRLSTVPAAFTCGAPLGSRSWLQLVWIRSAPVADT